MDGDTELGRWKLAAALTAAHPDVSHSPSSFDLFSAGRSIRERGAGGRGGGPGRSRARWSPAGKRLRRTCCSASQRAARRGRFGDVLAPLARGLVADHGVGGAREPRPLSALDGAPSSTCSKSRARRSPGWTFASAELLGGSGQNCCLLTPTSGPWRGYAAGTVRASMVEVRKRTAKAIESKRWPRSWIIEG